MNQRRVGLWLIGAFGGVGASVALGVAALKRGGSCNGLVTSLAEFEGIGLDPPGSFMIGGHDVRCGDFAAACSAVGGATPAYNPVLIEHTCRPELDEWSGNIRPAVLTPDDRVGAALADRKDIEAVDSPHGLISRLQADWREFRSRHSLDQIVVVNVASTEPPPESHPAQGVLVDLRRAAAAGDFTALPASGWYALAAIEMGLPYVNFTPSCGASVPALVELAEQRQVPIAGRDGKTGETLVKSALARMFALRNLRVLSWVGHNILGNRDGLVLSDPANRASKLKSKDRALADILGYQPQTRTTIEYVESLDDWKTAWDHVHFQGFLGVPMTLQFTWHGCDSALAAPLVIDLARLTAFAQRRGEGGVLRHLAAFFKSPMGVDEHDLVRQHAMLDEYARAAR